MRGEVLARCLPGAPLRLSFQELHAAREDRGRIVGLFLAILELARMGLITLRQEGIFGPLACERAPAAEPAANN